MSIDDNAKVAVLRARQLLKDKRYPDALQVCTDELARGTDDPELRLVAAHSLLAQGRHEGAKKEALQVIRLDPEQPEAHRILADVACARGELATACEHLERVLEIEPGDGRSRSLLETLSRPSAMPTPGSGASAPRVRATSIERFVDSNGRPLAADSRSPRPVELPELQISDSMLQDLPSIDDTPAPLEVSDSMLMSAVEDQRAERLPAAPFGKDGPPGLRTLHDPPGRGPAGRALAPVPGASGGASEDWKPQRDAGAGVGQKYQGTLRLPALEDSPTEDEAPTMPLLRPSAPPEPQLRLDPMASRPVSHELRRNDGAEQPDPTLRTAQPRSPLDRRRPGAPLPLGGDFEDFEVEAASVPVSRRAAAAGRQQGGDPSQEKARQGGNETMPPFESIEEREDVGGTPATRDPSGIDASGEHELQGPPSGGLMAMMAGGSRDTVRGDDSLPTIGRGSARQPARKLSTVSAGEEDHGWDPEADAGPLSDPGLAPGDFGIADLMEPPDGAADSTEDAIERELVAAGISEPAARRRGSTGRALWIFASAVIVAAGVVGYFFYQRHQYIQGEWSRLRGAVHRSTPGAFKEVEAAAKRILDKRSSDKAASAALAFHSAALAIEFGEDRLVQTKQLLQETEGSESEWRTAARGYLSLVDDPMLAAGYLSKGVEVYPDSALLKYLQGRALAVSGHLEQAAEALQKALKQQPKYVSAGIQLAVLVGQQERGYEQALQQLDEILRANPDNVQALIERARLNAHHNKSLSQAAEDAARVSGELAEKAGRGQIGWAQLVLSQVSRRRGDAAAMSAALDAAIKAPPCCDPQYRYELAGEMLALYRYDDAYQQMRAALSDRSSKAEHLHRMARLLLEIGRPREAAGYVQRAPARLLETKLLAGWLAHAQGRHAKAEPLLTQVLAEDKDHLEAAILLALTHAGSKRAAEALKRLGALAAAHPGNHRIQQVIGTVHYHADDLAAAEKALRASWKLNGLDPRTATYLARVSVKQHDHARAEKRYRTALKRRPDFAPAHIGLARLKLRAGRVDEARRQAALIAAVDRESPAYHGLLAAIDLAEGKLDSAEANIGRAEAAGARLSLLSQLRGELALLRGNAREAVKQLAHARRGEPNNTALLVMLGRAQAAAAMTDDAYSSFKAALKQDPDDPQALLELGKIGILDQEVHLAIRDLQRALAAMKKRDRPRQLQAAAYSALGLAYLRKKDTGQAIANLEDAIDRDPTAAEPHYHMGMTYDALQRPNKSVGFYAKAIELDPDLVDAYRLLGKAYIKLGDGENARRHLAAYLGKNPPARLHQEANDLLRKLQ